MKADKRAGIEHEFLKGRWAESLVGRGYVVEVEARRPPDLPGHVDILAVKLGKKLAVEIETGKSIVVANIVRDVMAGVDRVIVVATDEEAFRKVRRKMNREGLLVDDRVELVLREEVDWERMW